MRVRLHVWASVLAVCVCLRAYEFICMCDYNIILLLYMHAQCVRTSVSTRMYVRACECRSMCGRVCVHECVRVRG